MSLAAAAAVAAVHVFLLPFVLADNCHHVVMGTVGGTSSQRRHIPGRREESTFT